MTAPTLLALADRLEAGDGGDRALDVGIAALTVPGFEKVYGDDGDEGPLLDHTKDGWRETMRLPRYTDSLDAAVTLIPAGMNWCARWETDRGYGGVLGPERPGATALSRTWTCYAATPERALAAAALRALDAEGAGT